MKIKNKKKFIIRILEILIILTTMILTPAAIKYATEMRGFKAVGGEYLLPFLALIIIIILETILEESEEKHDKHTKH